MRKIKIIALGFLSIFLINCSSENTTDQPEEIAKDWTPLNFIDNISNVNNMCSDGKNIYVGTKTNGVYSSTNNGDTWTQINNGIESPKKCRVYYLDGQLYLTTFDDFYKSSDGGKSWTKIWKSLKEVTSGSSPISICINRSSIAIGYISSIYLSMDNGNTWSRSRQPSWSPSFDDTYYPNLVKDVGSLDFNDGSEQIVTDGTSFFSLDTQSGNLYKSKGSTFEKLENTKLGVGGQNCITSVGTKIFYGSMTDGSSTLKRAYVSIDGSNSWSPFEQGLNNISFGVTNFTTYGTDIYGCYAFSVFVSNSNSSNWVQIGNDLYDKDSDYNISEVIKNEGYVFAKKTNGQLYKIEYK